MSRACIATKEKYILPPEKLMIIDWIMRIMGLGDPVIRDMVGCRMPRFQLVEQRNSQEEALHHSRGGDDCERWNAAEKEDRIVITAVFSYGTQNAFQRSE